MLQNNQKKLNVGIVTWFFPKLSETFILNQIVFLRKYGYNISIFAVKNACLNLSKEDIELENKIHETIKKWDLLSLVTYNTIPKLKKIINHLAETNKLDVLYFQFPDIAGEILSSKLFNIPTITVFHDIPKFSNSKNLNNLKKRFIPVFDNATIILAISKFTAEQIIKLGCPENKIIIHYMGVDPNIFREAPFHLINKKVKLLMIGRFVEKKGFEYGIQAVKRLIDNYPKIKFQLDIVGDGLLRDKLNNLTSRLGLNKNIILHGKLSQGEINRFLQKTHIIICPSITTKKGKREGLPVVLLEAIACGVPIVTSNHASIPGLVKSYPAIHMVSEKSVRGLSEAIKTIILDYKKYKYLMISYRQKLISEYGIYNLGKKLINILNLSIKIKDQSNSFQLFVKNLPTLLKQKIFSIVLVGSLARNENISSFSDIDLIIVFRHNQKISIKNINILRQSLKLLSSKLKMNISPQIFNEFDYSQMISPVLIRSFMEEGKVIWGANLIKKFRQIYKCFSQFNINLAILKRMLFQREIVRQLLVTQKPSTEQAYFIAKTTLFFLKDFIWLDKSIFLVSQDKISKFWIENYRNHLPLYLIKFLNRPKNLKNLDSFIEKGSNFIEIICDDAYKLLLKKYSYKKIQINAF